MGGGQEEVRNEEKIRKFSLCKQKQIFFVCVCLKYDLLFIQMEIGKSCSSIDSGENEYKKESKTPYWSPQFVVFSKDLLEFLNYQFAHIVLICC